MRCLLALLFGAALLRAAEPQFPAAAFWCDATHVAIVAGLGSQDVPQNATKLPEHEVRPPFGDSFALPDVSESDGIKTGDSFDINLTGNFWVRSTVTSFIFNKTEWARWMFAIAAIDPDDRERYAAAIEAKLQIFLAEPARAKLVSDTGQIRNPVMKIDLSPSQRAALETKLNDIMRAKVQQAMLKDLLAPEKLLSTLLGGKANLVVEVVQVNLGPPLGVRQHVLGTWDIGGGPQDVDDKTVFSVQGWKRPDADQIEILEAIDGVPEDKAEIIGAIGDWAEESLDDFAIENVFPGGRLIRASAGYESSTIYLERMTEKGREFVRILYGS